MTALSRSARWAALDAVWCEAARAAARGRLGGVPWQSLGSCGARTDLPWIGEPEDVGPWDAESMRSACRACPVLAECAAYVEEANVCAGWWAGTHRDPAYVEPARPGWVSAPGASEATPAWQGVLPLGGVA